MPSKTEKEKRNQIKKEVARREYDEFIKSIPIGKGIILELFDHLNSELSERNCNHDYSITTEFLDSKNIGLNIFIEWLQENGGYCDCEILYNIEDKLEE